MLIPLCPRCGSLKTHFSWFSAIVHYSVKLGSYLFVIVSQLYYFMNNFFELNWLEHICLLTRVDTVFVV